jgi:hypothetical protein
LAPKFRLLPFTLLLRGRYFGLLALKLDRSLCLARSFGRCFPLLSFGLRCGFTTLLFRFGSCPPLLPLRFSLGSTLLPLLLFSGNTRIAVCARYLLSLITLGFGRRRSSVCFRLSFVLKPLLRDIKLTLRLVTDHTRFGFNLGGGLLRLSLWSHPGVGGITIQRSIIGEIDRDRGHANSVHRTPPALLDRR